MRQAIHEEEEQAERRHSIHAGNGTATLVFQPVMQAVEELRRELESTPSIKVTVNPDSVWLALADRELKVTYNPTSRRFVGEETAHAWIDGEPYGDRHEWDTADASIESLIRLCARYVQMAKILGQPAVPG